MSIVGDAMLRPALALRARRRRVHVGGTELAVEATGPVDDAGALAQEPPARAICDVWFEGGEIDEIHSRAGWSGGVDEVHRTAWISPLYIALMDDLVDLLPTGYEPLGTYFAAQVEALSADSTATPTDLQKEILDETGLDSEQLEELEESLTDELESTCGPAIDLDDVEIADPADLPAHVRRVVAELRVGRAVDCLGAPSATKVVESTLDEAGSNTRQGFVDTGTDRAPLITLALGCGVTEAEAAMFAWRVSDIDWWWAMLPPTEQWADIVELLTIDRGGVDPIVTSEAYEETASEVAAPETTPDRPEPEPTPDVYVYPIEGLVADVLGTLGIFDAPAACLVEAGLLEPAELWLDESGANPDMLTEQRAVLERVAEVCGFGADDVDAWLDLAHQYAATAGS